MGTADVGTAGADTAVGTADVDTARRTPSPRRPTATASAAGSPTAATPASTTSQTTAPTTVDARVLLVHERFTELGGSEAVVANLARTCPRSTVFVPIADPALRVPGLDAVPCRTSRVQRLYRGGGYAHTLPLLPLAMRWTRLGTEDYDAVVLSHHAFANRVPVSAGTPVVSYVHTPARWMWQADMRRGEAGAVGGVALAAFAALQRGPDRRAAERVDVLLANSTAVSRRIRRWWGRDAEVVPPPVDVASFTSSPQTAREDFFLLAGRLVPYKRPEVAVAAAREAGVRLVVVGEGRQLEECRRLAGPRTEFVGRVDNETLRDLYRRCRALVFPGPEDFGIVPVEAQACGAPVIALGAGGACDTVVPDRTGQLIAPTGTAAGDASRFATAMRAFDVDAYDPQVVRAHAETFSETAFRTRMAAVLRSVLDRP